MTLAQAYKQQFGEVSYPFEIYNANGKQTYFENSDGYWEKIKHDTNGNRTYFEDSDGYWVKREYDANDEMTYFEDNRGRIKGKKQSSCDGKKHKLKEL